MSPEKGAAGSTHQRIHSIVGNILTSPYLIGLVRHLVRDPIVGTHQHSTERHKRKQGSLVISGQVQRLEPELFLIERQMPCESPAQLVLRIDTSYQHV